MWLQGKFCKQGGCHNLHKSWSKTVREALNNRFFSPGWSFQGPHLPLPFVPSLTPAWNCRPPDAPHRRSLHADMLIIVPAAYGIFACRRRHVHTKTLVSHDFMSSVPDRSGLGSCRWISPVTDVCHQSLGVSMDGNDCVAVAIPFEEAAYILQ